ncbi:MAG: hypothetical protein NZ108_09755, partial [Bacteroidia bacterium]|nr:hypothetical protein [Bacteroidia bacterium]
TDEEGQITEYGNNVIQHCQTAIDAYTDARLFARGNLITQSDTALDCTACLATLDSNDVSQNNYGVILKPIGGVSPFPASVYIQKNDFDCQNQCIQATGVEALFVLENTFQQTSVSEPVIQYVTNNLDFIPSLITTKFNDNHFIGPIGTGIYFNHYSLTTPSLTGTIFGNRMDSVVADAVGDTAIGLKIYWQPSTLEIGGGDSANVINVNAPSNDGWAIGAWFAYPQAIARVDSNYFTCHGYASGLVVSNAPNYGGYESNFMVYGNEFVHIGDSADNPITSRSVALFFTDRGQNLITDGDDGPCFATVALCNIHAANQDSGFQIGIHLNETSNNLHDVDVLIGSSDFYASNHISNCNIGIRVNGVSRSNIRGNYSTLDDCDIGIDVYGGIAIIEKNRFAINDTAIWSREKGLVQPDIFIKGNKFENLTPGDKYIVCDGTGEGDEANMSLNWWGTADYATV